MTPEPPPGPTALVPGQLLTRPMTAAGPPQVFTFPLAAGEFTTVTVEQRGIDVALRLWRGEVEETYVDSPNGPAGAEVVTAIAEAAGEWRLEVVPSGDAATAGTFEVELGSPHPVTAEERERVAADRDFARGEGHRRAGLWVEALAQYEVARRGYEALGALAAVAAVNHRRGWVQESLGRFDDAAEALQLAEHQAVTAGEEGLAALISRHLGSLQITRGQLDAAEAAYHRAHQRYRARGEEGEAVKALDGLARVAKDRGHFELSRQLYHEVRAVYEKLGTQTALLRVLVNLGDLSLQVGRLDDARASFHEALRLAADDEPDAFTAIARHRLGEIAQRQENYDLALQLLEASLAEWRALAKRNETTNPAAAREAAQGAAGTRSSFGTVHLKRGDYPKAREAYEKVRDIGRNLEDAHTEAVAELSLGRVAFEEGDYSRAEAAHRTAQRLFEQVSDPVAPVSNRFGLGRALFFQQRWSEARSALEPVMAELEGLRAAVGSFEIRATYLASKQDYWELYIATLMRLHAEQPRAGFDRRALETVERFRARSLQDLLSGAGITPRSNTSPELAAALDRVNVELRGLFQQRLAAGGLPRNALPVITLAERERALLTEHDRLLARQRRESPQDAVEEKPGSFDLAAAQKLLDPHTTFVVYSLGKTEGYLWVVKNNSVAAFTIDGRDQIDPLVDILTKNLAQRSDTAEKQAQQAALALAEKLLSPGQTALTGSRRLAIVPDGSLGRVPFAYLPIPWVPNERLIRACEIVYLPSIATLAKLRQRRAGKPLAGVRQLAMVADPVFELADERVQAGSNTSPSPPQAADELLSRSQGSLGIEKFPRLPGTADEGREILALFPNPQDCKTLTGFDANLESLLGGALRGHRMVHFATHAVAHPTQPELSGLVLSLVDAQGATRHGFLALHDIYRLPLDAQLVVLSACDTGAGRWVGGEGVVGLSRGFFSAGADFVVASLWKVEDRATARFMTQFYSALLGGPKKPTLRAPGALRQAQAAALADPEKTIPPAVWASFVPLGDWDFSRPPQDPDIENPPSGGVPPPPVKLITDFPPPKKEKDPPHA